MILQKCFKSVLGIYNLKMTKSLFTLAFQQLNTSEIPIIPYRHVGRINVNHFSNIDKMLKKVYAYNCFNCTFVQEENMICRNCLMFGNFSNIAESNMRQVYISLDDIIETENRLTIRRY